MIENVGTNLASPADIGLAFLDRGRLRAPILQLEFVELGLELVHRRRLVLVLRPIVLALHDGVRRQRRYAHGGLGAVYVLAARTARAVDVDPKVGRIHLDIDVVVHLRRNEHRRERRVAAITRIEW